MILRFTVLFVSSRRHDYDSSRRTLYEFLLQKLSEIELCQVIDLECCLEAGVCHSVDRAVHSGVENKDM